jgi:hypothetical protein
MQAALAAAQQAAVHYRTIADGGVDAQRVFLRSSQGGGGSRRRHDTTSRGRSNS